ncbi:MAG: hypothetical protein DSY53_01290, partial [Persephonella sp.]
MVRKDLIKKYFSRFSKTYCREAYIQKKTAKDLIDFGRELIYGIGVDLGSGTGYIADFLKDKNISIINIDLSRDMLKAVEFGINIQGDIENLPFKDNSFNFVISSFSLHWTDLNKSFKEINRILKAGGVFIVQAGGGMVFPVMATIGAKLKQVFKYAIPLKVEMLNGTQGFWVAMNHKPAPKWDRLEAIETKAFDKSMFLSAT